MSLCGNNCTNRKKYIEFDHSNICRFRKELLSTQIASLTYPTSPSKYSYRLVQLQIFHQPKNRINKAALNIRIILIAAGNQFGVAVEKHEK